MKFKSIILSIFLIFGGALGAFGLSMSAGIAQAVSANASVWDGTYATSQTVNSSDIDILAFTIDGAETSLTSSSVVTYRIYTAKGFSYFANEMNNGLTFANKTIVLECDIDLNRHAWIPMGGSTAYFAGTFDGNSKTIYNLANDEVYSTFGLFREVRGTVRNLNVVSADISFSNTFSTDHYVGAIAGTLVGGTISNCSVRGEISSSSTATTSYVGGLVGYARGTGVNEGDSSSPASITNCANYASVSGISSVGGLVGRTSRHVEIKASFNLGEISNILNSSTSNISVGGLVGSESGAIVTSTEQYLRVENSFNNGDIVLNAGTNNITAKAGGLLGSAEDFGTGSSLGNYFKFSRVYNAGDFSVLGYSSATTRTVYVGGLVGYAVQPRRVFSDDYLISYAFNVGNLVAVDNSTELTTIGSNLHFREIIASPMSDSMGSGLSQFTIFYDYDAPYQIFYTTRAYNDIRNLVSVPHLDGKATSYEFLSTTPNATQGIYGVDFEFYDGESGYWLLSETVNEGLPYLHMSRTFEDGNDDWSTTVSGAWLGDGTLSSPYLIYTAEDLSLIADTYNAGNFSPTSITYFSLQNDIDLSSKAWEPIGVNNYSFKNAVFDGNGFTISNINCSLQVDYGQSIGLFGTIENAVVRNVIISNFRFLGSETPNANLNRATLVGNAVNSYIINCVDNTNFTSDNFTGQAVYTVASASSSYLIYGKNNLADTSYTAGMTNISPVANNSLTKGVEAYLNTDGGAVYDEVLATCDRTITPHLGDGRFVLVNNSVFPVLLDASSNLYDRTYLTTLPVDTINAESDEDLANSFYIVKEGYKVVEDGYICDNTLLTNFSGTGGWVNLITLGLTAVWEEADDLEFRVYYNSYERYYHTVTREDGAVNYDDVEGQNGAEEDEENSENDKYLVLNLPYNTFNSKSGFKESVEKTIAGLTREGYEIVGVFENFLEGEYLGDNILDDTDNTGYFFNANKNYYLKWTGTDTSYSFTINLFDTATTIANNGYPNRYEWNEAIERIDVNFYSTLTNGTVGVCKTLTYTDFVSDQVTFNYTTAELDEHFEKVEVRVKLKLGFTFDIENYSDAFVGPSNIIANPDYAEYISNYGSAFVLCPAPGSIPEWNDSTSGGRQEEAVYTFGQAIGDISLNVELARSSNQFNLSLGEGVYYALTVPYEVGNAGNVDIFTGEGATGYITLDNFNYEFFSNVGNNSFYFGLNMFDNYLISSARVFDLETNGNEYLHFNGDEAINDLVVRLYFRENEADERYMYFLYEYAETTYEGEPAMAMTLYLVETAEGVVGGQESYYRTYNGYTFKILDRIARITRTGETVDDRFTSVNYTLDFYTNQEFGLIFSTESADNYMTEYSGTLESETFEVLMPANDEEVLQDNLQKIFYNFAKAKESGENFYSLSAYIPNSGDTIMVLQQRITAKINIQFVDEYGNLLQSTEEMPLPTIYLGLDGEDSNVFTRYTEGSSITISPLTSTSTTFRIVNNEYYQWTYRQNDITDTSVGFSEFYGQTEDGAFTDNGNGEKLSYELYLNIVQDGAMFDADGNRFNYEELNENSTLDDYFVVHEPNDSSSEIMGITGLIYDGQKTAFDFNMYYNEANTTTSSGRQPYALPNYDFVLTFVLKGVNYSVNIETKYKQTASSDLYNDNTNASEVWAGVGDNYRAGDSVMLEVAETFGMTTGSAEVATMSARNGDASGYTFAGFQVIRENGTISEYVSYETYAEYDSMLSFLESYNDYLGYDATNDSYAINLQAIYISKSVNYEASGSGDLNNITDGGTIVEDYNGTDAFRYLSQGIYESTGISTGIYYYGNSATGAVNDLGVGDFTFEMNEYYSNRYRFTGVALMEEESYLSASGNYDDSLFLTMFSNGDVLIENGGKITLDGDLVKNYFHSNIGALSGQTIYIVPVAVQKTVIVSLTSGANLGETVYDISGDIDTTLNTVELKFYYNTATNIEFNKEYLKNKENELESYYLVSTQDSVILNEYFYKKAGYQPGGWVVYDATGENVTPIYINYYRIDENYFNSQFADVSGEADYRVTFARTYRANTYYINYSSGDQRVDGSTVYGVSTGITSSTLASYDTEFQIQQNGFFITGYRFIGWNTQIDGMGRIFQPGETVTENLCTGDGTDTSITLYAQWEAKSYNLEINFNGGHIGEETSMVIEDVTYNTLLSALGDIEVERTGFVFDGFYTLAPGEIKSDYYLVDEYSYFNTSIYGFADNEGGVAVTIYATWRFDGEIALEVGENTKTFAYTGEDISLPIEEFSLSGTNLSFSYENGLNISTNFTEVNTSYSLNGATLNGVNIVLPASNVGTYYLYFTVSLTDNSTYFKNGELTEATCEFIVIITPADVSFALSNDLSLYYENIKYLVSLVETETVSEQFAGYGSFLNLVNALKASGVIDNEVSLNHAYEFLFMKYFNMVNNRIINADTYNSFITFRNWTYADYYAYYENFNYFSEGAVTGDEEREALEGDRLTRANVLSNAFLLSYDVSSRISSVTLYGDGATGIYSASQFVLTSTSSSVIANQLQISSIEVSSAVSFEVNSSYEVRAYIEGTSEALSNYNLNTVTVDGEERAYINLPNMYVLLQILRLNNNSALQAKFYNQNATQVSVDYVGENQNSYFYPLDRDTYTQLEEESNLYINLNLYTSNIGNSQVDTTYNFYTPENHFDFSTYQVLNVSGETTTNVTTSVNLLLSEDFTFTIYSVKNVAQITLNAGNLTYQNGVRDIYSLDTQYQQNVFKITGIGFTLDGEEYTYELETGMTDGRYYNNDSQDVLLMEIAGSGTMTPTIVVTEPVTSLTIQATERFGEYIRLVEFGREFVYTFNGDGVRTTGEYIIDLSEESSEIEFEEDSITYVNYYATYSDLVKVVVDYNLPADNQEMQSYLQLGVDTESDLPYPTADFLACERLSYVQADGTELDVNTIFTGANGTYIGYTSNIFAQINLKAYWRIGRIIITSQDVTYRQSVGTLPNIFASNVCVYSNSESELFDYLYQIVFTGTDGTLNEVVAESRSIYSLVYNLENSGTLEHNGSYKLVITVTMKEEYRSILSDPSNYTLTDESVTFEVDLQALRIADIELVGENPTTYDGEEHNDRFSLNISYYEFNSTLNDYDTENMLEAVFTYGQEGLFTITIHRGESLVYSIINVADYTITFSPNTNYYILEDGVTTSFTYTIAPYVVDLELEKVYLSKKFNTTDSTPLQYVTTRNNETLTFNFTRDNGEDLGEYNLYLASPNGFTCSNFSTNYQIVYGDTVLYDGALANLDTAVGVFEIVKSDTLRLSWEGENIEVDYSAEGYKLQINNGEVVVLRGTERVTNRTLAAFDVTSNSSANLSIISDLLNYDNITLMLYNSDSVETAINSAVYEIRAIVKEGALIANYYQNIVFDESAIFQILPMTINVSGMSFDTIYNGEDTRTFVVEGYTGVSIIATYPTIHAGENLRVTLSLAVEGAGQNNYALSSTTAIADIAKRDATLHITPNYAENEDSYTYGDISRSNMEEVLSIDVQDADGTNINSMFYVSSYTLSLDLTGAESNHLGYFYVGEYDISIVASTFDDFNMTIAPSSMVSITPYYYEIVLPENYITITTLDNVSAYSDTRTLDATGDTLNLTYVPEGLTQGVPGALGQYNLVLSGANEFANGSVIVSLVGTDAFNITATDETIFVKFDDGAFDSHAQLYLPYNGYTYSISVSESGNSMLLTSANTSFSAREINFSFIRKTGAGDEVYNGNITSVSISLIDSSSFRNAGSYRLYVNVTAEGAMNFAFYDNYYITVQPIEVDALNLDLVKTYDGTNRKENIDFNERINDGTVNDDVSVTAVYPSSQVGENYNVTLYLVGTSARNYTFSSGTPLGEITKANATIALSQNSYTYGDIMQNSAFSYLVTSGENSVSNTEYSVVATIRTREGLDPSFSDGGNLIVGSYTLSLNISSTNYIITPTSLDFAVTPYTLTFIFATDGVYRTSYGSAESLSSTFVRDYNTPFGDDVAVTFTRETGSEVGNYNILSASVSDSNYIAPSEDSVTDESPNGAYRITPSNNRYYLLISDANTVSPSDESAVSMSIGYDGLTYSNIQFVVDRNNNTYKIRLSDSLNGNEYEYTLNLYSFDSETNTYIKANDFDATLTATLRFATGVTVRNVGSYSVYADSISSTNFDVTFGMASTLSAYAVTITPKTLTYQVSSVSKVFDNKDAVITFADASTIFNGIVSRDSVSVTFTLYDDDTIARFAGAGYTVQAVLTNGANYEISGSITGEITKAPIGISIGSVTITYGQQPEIQYELDYGDLDLTYYDKTGITAEISIAGEYSTSRNYKVTESGYVISAELAEGVRDFALTYYLNEDGEEVTDSPARLFVTPRTLTIIQKTTPLREVFTKLYDGTDEVVITDENGLLFNLVNVAKGDIVDVSEARYNQIMPGTGLTVTFSLTGADAENYLISTYQNGEIEYQTLYIDFDYQAEGVTADVDEESILESVKYPFSATSFLTLNTTNSAKNAFPTMLIGRNGFTFNGWTLNLSAQEGSAEYSFLNGVLRDLDYDLAGIYQNGMFFIPVNNDSVTVSLIGALLSDGNDYFNLYEDNSSARVTFTANWVGNSYYLNIVMQNASGVDLGDSYGSFAHITVNNISGTDVTSDEMISSTYQTSVSHGNRVEIEVTLEEYIRLVGVYNNTTGEEFTFDDVVSGDGFTTYVIANITSTANLAFRFTYENIAIVLDLTSFVDEESGLNEVSFNDDRFINLSNNTYSYTTTCDNVLDATLSSLPVLTRIGYTVTGYVLNGTAVDVSDFEETAILAYATRGTGGYNLTYYPTFDVSNVDVTLDYAYDNIVEHIFVPYNDMFKNALDGAWVETPEREGYIFTGWTDEAGSLVNGDSVLTDAGDVTLTATWQIQQNYVTLEIDDNLQLLSSNVEYSSEGSIVTFNNMNYGDTLSFTLEASEGYELDIVSYEHGAESGEISFTVDENNGSIYLISFNIPAQPNVQIVATSKVKQNDVVLVGEHFTLTRVTSGNEDIAFSNNTFEVDSDIEFVMSVVIEQGYTFVGVSVDEANANDVSVETHLDGFNLTLTVSGVVRDITITLETGLRENSITFTYGINDAIEQIIANDRIVANNTALVTTGNDLVVYVDLFEGYVVDGVTFSHAGGNDQAISFSLVEDAGNDYNGFYTFTIEDIYADGGVNVSIGYQTYTISTGIVAYDETGALVTDESVLGSFTVLVNGLESDTVNFNTVVTLTASTSLSDYNFAGWSRDQTTILSTESTYSHTVTSDETLYAVFSKTQFSVSLSAFSYYILNQEYNDTALEEEVYSPIYAHFFEEGSEVFSTSIYYGSSKTITLRVPDGYTFYGYGYILNAQYNGTTLASGEFRYAYIGQNTDREIDLTLDTLYMLDLGFGEGGRNNSVPLFVALAPNSLDINVNSYLNYDGYLEEDNLVGDITLIGYTDDEITEVNEYGYVSNTLNHYKDYLGSASLQNFTLVTSTGHDVYLKIGTTRAGYYLQSVISSNERLLSVQYIGEVSEDATTYAIYRLYNIVGSVDSLDLNINFEPQKHIVNFNFRNENDLNVDGGNIFLEVEDAMANKVWGNGSNFSSLQVVGFTDTYFNIVAYVRLGFMLDLDNINLSYDSTKLIISNVVGYRLDFAENNYNYVLYFRVSALSDSAEVLINLTAQTYRVVLNDITLDNPQVAVIENVKFYETLDLSAENSNNITSNLGYSNGQLNIVQTRQDYTFGGYFTYAGGRGRQYINSSGQTLLEFTETGYILDENTGRYALSDNAYIADDGVVVINLYLYWSYLKTQITFSLTPSLRTNITAEDLVSGENSANSWFNRDMPMYIEVAFNTNITFTAPEIEGYEFYKFVIKQKDANNNYLADVVSYSNNVPWSTNERDRIVEMTIEVHYFARINVTVSGGEMDYEITQNFSDYTTEGRTNAEALVREGYVDTTKDYTLTALENDGYDFNYWYKVSTKQRYSIRSITDRATSYVNYILAVQGKRATLSFERYDTTSGYIESMLITRAGGSQQIVRLGQVVNGEFVKNERYLTYDVRVGDTVTFNMVVYYGFGVSWDLENVSLVNIDRNYLYFSLPITGDMAEKTTEINPTFVGESMAIYINNAFADGQIIENATDGNNASYAGYVMYEGARANVILREIGTDLTLRVVVNARYNLTGVTIINYYGETIDAMNFYDSEQGTLSFTRAEIDEYSLAGTAMMTLEFERLYFEASAIEEQGAGTGDNPYLIYTIDDLTYYMEKINSGAVNASGRLYARASYVVMSDLSLNEKFWTPIGTLANPFNGTFNFNAHVISDIYLAQVYSPTSYGGLFGVIGNSAHIYRNQESYWYIFLIILILILLLILLIILLIYNKRKKQKREELNKK